MEISCCTAVVNAVERDYHLLEWIEQHCPLFDEVVIADCGSTDSTPDLLEAMLQKYDNLVVVTKYIKDDGTPKWYRDIKRVAVDAATNDGIFLLDCDEFLHEKFINRVKAWGDIWEKDPHIVGWINYKSFIGNLFTELAGYAYTQQDRLICKSNGFYFSIDAGNISPPEPKIIRWPLTRQIVVWHMGAVRRQDAFDAKRWIQKHRMIMDHQEETLKYSSMKPEDVELFGKMDISLKEDKEYGVFQKTVSGFPKVIAENPREFFRQSIDDIDEELLEKFENEEFI